MNSTEMERKVRDLLSRGEIGAMEGLLVDAADWGVNIRMTLNSQFIEIDLIKNWDGFEVILLNDQEKNTVQIDELQDLLQILNGDYWSWAWDWFGWFSKKIFNARMTRFKVSVNELAIITGFAPTWYP